MKKIIVVLAVASGIALGASAQDPAEFFANQMRDLRRALSSPQANARVQEIWFELADYSGEVYRVLPAQNFNVGQALPDGTILLDLSIAGNRSREVVAFWLAHEWAHQVLGHTRLLVTPMGQWIAAMSGTAHEDAADEWAAGFLDDMGYEPENVLEFLCSMPHGGQGDSHSTGPERAAIVAEVLYVDSPCEPELFDISLRIWSRQQGDAMTMEVHVDDDYMGDLGNISGYDRELELGELEEGDHAFALEDMTLFGPYGQTWGPFYCRGTMRVARDAVYRLSARVNPDGSVFCRLD